MSLEQALHRRFGDQIEVVQSPAPGPSAATNKGCRQARGDLVIGLDDDMEAVEDFIMAHVNVHRANGNSKIAVTGYSPVVFDENVSPIIRELAKSFEGYFQELDSPGRKCTPLDICAGNFSMSLAGFRAVGGFNESYPFQRCDFELAVRLLENGYKFGFSRSARAGHRMAIDGNTLIGRATERAQVDYRLAREHPSCLPYLQLYRPLCDATARRRWLALWKTCGAAALILGVLRKLLPNNARLFNLQYLSRYCIGLKKAAVSWDNFCSLEASLK